MMYYDEATAGRNLDNWVRDTITHLASVTEKPWTDADSSDSSDKETEQ